MTREEFKQLTKLVNTLKKQVKEIDANGDAYTVSNMDAIRKMRENAAELHTLLDFLIWPY